MVIQKNIVLAPFTPFKVGEKLTGTVLQQMKQCSERHFILPPNKQLPLFCLGRGSNVLIHDFGFRGLIIHLAAMDHITVDSTRIICGAWSTCK